MTVTSRDSLHLSLAYTSWITDELRELARQREARLAARANRPYLPVMTAAACAAVAGVFRFLVP